MLRKVDHKCRHQPSSDGGVLGRLLAPLQLGATELLPTVAKLYGALGVNSLRNSALTQLGKTLLKQSARYDVALTALCKGGIRTAERQLAVQARARPPPALDLCNVMMVNAFLGLHLVSMRYHEGVSPATSHLCHSALKGSIC